jgi:hypothetical protein
LAGTSSPYPQGPVALKGGGDALLAEQVAVLIERGGGVGGLVGVDADHHRHGGAFLEGQQDTGRAGRLWAETVLC